MAAAETLTLTVALELAAVRRELAAIAARLSPAGLAQIIAEEIARQDNEIDNLGDGESVCFVGKDLPTINLVELAEKILAAIRTAAEPAIEEGG